MVWRERRVDAADPYPRLRIQALHKQYGVDRALAHPDGDTVPDVADNCPTAKGPRAGAGCPDRDGDTVFDSLDRCPTAPGASFDGCPNGATEKVVAFLDGKKVDAKSVFTKHGAYKFQLKGKLKKGRDKHKLVVKWFDGGQLVGQVKKKFKA